jgi:hypothetical protein
MFCVASNHWTKCKGIAETTEKPTEAAAAD